jgi:hypothetical protein
MEFYDGMYWSWGPYNLPPNGGFDVGDILASAQSALQMLNYGQIKVDDTGTENSWWVCGYKDGTSLLAIYMWNGNNSFTQVIAANSAGTATDEVNVAGQDAAAFEAKLASIGWE